MLVLIIIAGLACVIALSITDLREGRLPNRLVAALAMLGGANFFLSETSPGLTDMAIGLVVGSGTLIKKRWCAPNRPENQANSDFLTFHDKS